MPPTELLTDFVLLTGSVLLTVLLMMLVSLPLIATLRVLRGSVPIVGLVRATTLTPSANVLMPV